MVSPCKVGPLDQPPSFLEVSQQLYQQGGSDTSPALEGGPCLFPVQWHWVSPVLLDPLKEGSLFPFSSWATGSRHLLVKAGLGGRWQKGRFPFYSSRESHDVQMTPLYTLKMCPSFAKDTRNLPRPRSRVCLRKTNPTSVEANPFGSL